MQHQIQNLPKNQRKIEILIPASEFEKFFSKALEETRREMKIPGFRPGKAPADIALQRIDPRHLLEAASDTAVRQTLYPLIAEQKWETVGSPEVNIKKVARGSDFEYEAIFPLIPEIKLGDWKDLKVSKKPVEAKDDETEKVIQDLREQRADFIPIDRGIAKGDQVEMEYQMYMDNLRTEEGKQKTDKMIIGRGLFLPEVEENLIRLKAGDEKSFKIVYKPDYAQKRFAGKAVEFRVAIKGAYEAKLPEMTDEWVKSVGNFKNTAELREAIKKNLLSEKEAKEEERAELEALDLTLNTAAFGDIPEVLINSEMEIAKGEHSGHGHKDEYYESDEFRDRLENVLLSRKAVGFIKDQIIEKK